MTTRKLAYTPREAAMALGVSVSTIRREIAAGRLSTVPLTARVRVIPAVELEALVASARKANQ